MLWLVAAICSAFFAGITAILSKVGVKNTNSDLATAIRTGVVLLFSWLIVFIKKETKPITEIPKKDLLFVALSGITTGASWLCYYYAIKYGQVSVVVPIDKLSVLITVAFSVIFLKEKLKPKAIVGLVLLVSATVSMAVFT